MAVCNHSAQSWSGVPKGAPSPADFFCDDCEHYIVRRGDGYFHTVGVKCKPPRATPPQTSAAYAAKLRKEADEAWERGDKNESSKIHALASRVEARIAADAQPPDTSNAKLAALQTIEAALRPLTHDDRACVMACVAILLGLEADMAQKSAAAARFIRECRP